MASMAYPEYGFDFSFVQGLVSHVHGLWERASYGCIYGTVRLGFVTKHGVNFIPWYAFTAPLQGEVWLVTLIIMIFICTVQFTTMYFLNQRKVQNVVLDSGTIIPYAMIMEQGLQDIPKGIRYYSFILLLGGIILSTAYKSTLRVNLVFPLKENIPKTFSELTQRVPEYEVSLWILGLERYLILGNKAIESFGSKLQFIENPNQAELLIKLFQEKDGKSAIISWKTFLGLNIAKHLSLNEKLLGLAFSKDDIYTIYLTPVFVHQSIYTDSFFGIYNGILESGIYEKNTEWAIQEFVQDGQLKQEKKDVNSQIYKDLIELQNSEELQTKPMTLWNLRVVFAIIPLGGILALFAFLCEIGFFSKLPKWMKYYYHHLFNDSALMSPIVSVTLWTQKWKRKRTQKDSARK